MALLFMLSNSLRDIWVTTTWAKKHYCPNIKWMNSWIPEEVLNKRHQAEENHWVISSQTRFDSTGNNVALISVYSLPKKNPFVRWNERINSFFFFFTYSQEQAGLLSGMQDLCNHTCAAEETSPKYQWTVWSCSARRIHVQMQKWKWKYEFGTFISSKTHSYSILFNDG